MGWGFRKSVKFGPMRVNFSKSGIGVSAGVKGARVSVGPRGTHLNIGRGPFYYRQKIGGSSRAQGGTVHLPTPEAVSTMLPPDSPYQRPAFPKHGLPRIVRTSGLLAGILLVIGIISSSNLDKVSPSSSQPPSAPTLKAESEKSPAVPSPTLRPSKSKRKNIPAELPAAAAAPAIAPPYQVSDNSRQSVSAPTTPRSSSQSGLIRGPRGGCYYYSGSGRKVYVDRSMCN